MLYLIGPLPAKRLPMTVPRAIPVMLAILVIPCFARLDRDFDFRAVTCPLDRAQDTSLRFIRDQSQQLSIFLVRLLKGESPISHSARVTHGISTPTQHREFKHETGNRSCTKVRPPDRLAGLQDQLRLAYTGAGASRPRSMTLPLLRDLGDCLVLEKHDQRTRKMAG